MSKSKCGLVEQEYTEKILRKRDDSIGRILIMEFQEEDSLAFDEIMMLLKHRPEFEKIHLNDEIALSMSGLNIYPEQRKVYYEQQEIPLTVKEYGILCLLVSNRGWTLTYAQIYEKVWGEVYSGRENKAIKFHIYHLRDKLNEVAPDETFIIRCVRGIGYCFEINSEKSI